MIEMFSHSELLAAVNIAASYRIQRDAEYGPLIPWDKRPGFRRLVELTNYHSAMLGTVMPLMTDGELEFLFTEMKHGRIKATENELDHEAFVELLGVLNSRRRLRNGV